MVELFTKFEDSYFRDTMPYEVQESPTYSDTSEVHSPPTSILQYILPNEEIKMDEPYLQIIEQPQSRFRFRYKSEMLGTHGQLKAERADKNRPVFPTVKLHNWNKGAAIIHLQLWTADEGVTRKRHVHELSGKHVSKETGTCEVVVDEKTDYTAKFQNLGIVHIARREVKNILIERQKEEMISHAMLRMNNQTREQIISQIHDSDIAKITKIAEEEAKNMDLNKVVLRFRAFSYNNTTKKHQAITRYTDSEPVMNLKNASTGELKIVRMSACSAPCTGGTEVWMLVEKVKKNNIKVKFYEEDQDEKVTWCAYGHFTDSDVHHQYAIVFKTPPYKVSDLSCAVKVKVQLERSTDKDLSEPMVFTYLPEENTRKRPLPYNMKLNEGDDFQNSITPNPKKLCPSYYAQPLDLTHSQPDQPFFRPPQGSPQSPAFIVPSPIVPVDSPNGGMQCMYSPTTNTMNNPTITIQESPVVTNYQYSTLGMESFHYQIASPATSDPSSIGSPQYQNLSPTQNGASPQYIEALSPGRVVPSSPIMDNNIQNGTSFLLETLQSTENSQSSPPQFIQQQLPIQQHSPKNYVDQSPDGFCAVLNQQNYTTTSLQDIQGLPAIYNANEKESCNLFDDFGTINICDLINPDTMSGIMPNNTGDLRTDCAAKKKKPTNDIDDLTDKISKVQVTEKNEEVKEQDDSNKVKETLRDSAFKVAVRAAECLQAYAATGDIALLLDTHRYLLAVQNAQGDNALHTAVANRNWEAFNKILKAAERVKPIELLNATNVIKETALHLAIKGNEPNMVFRLLSVPGCDATLPDIVGNTAIHLASSMSKEVCLSMLINNLKKPILQQVINAYNYQGETPLHMAVTSGNIKAIDLLVKGGADVHSCERKRGANPLHLAVLHQRYDAVHYLINKTNITIEAGMFDGNTVLHIAVLAKDPQLCRILMLAGADPFAKNMLHRRKSKDGQDRDEDSENDEESEKEESSDPEEDMTKEEDFYTPLDYVEDNDEIKAILLRQSDKSDRPSTVDSGIDL